MVLPLPVKIFWGFESGLQTNPMPFYYFDSPWNATLMPLIESVRWTGRNRILKVGKNCGSVLTNLWTKVHEILGKCKGPHVRDPLYFTTHLLGCPVAKTSGNASTAVDSCHVHVFHYSFTYAIRSPSLGRFFKC